VFVSGVHALGCYRFFLHSPVFRLTWWGVWQYRRRRRDRRMGLNLYVVLGSAIVGLLVGLTGAGGGALMTPMLILLFSVKPSAAISSDLVAAVVMRPVGAAVHLHKGTVNLRMVGLMTLGSVPMAFLGSFLLRGM